MLRRNITANYISQAYATLLSILIIPFYLERLGSEAFGLIGFFLILQVAFSQLDAGLTGSVTRETARTQTSGDTLSYRRLLRAVELFFLATGLLVGGALFLGAGQVERVWLNASDLPSHVVVLAIQVMAFALAARWYSGLQRGIIMGAERQVWLGGFNVVFATLRHPGAVALLYFLGPSVTGFFAYQAVLAGAELAVLIWMTRSIIPPTGAGDHIGWSLKPLKAVIGFSLSITFGSLVWLGITQLDQLVLSTVLPLAEFGAFTVAVTVARGVMLASEPIGLAVRPRLAKLHADGDELSFTRLYRQTTQFVSILAGSAGITLALFAHDFLLSWTRDSAVAQFAAPVTSLYALGMAVLGVGALPYYLQFAVGDLRLHVQYNLVSLVVRIPLIVAAAILYGAIGAGTIWLAWNLVFFFVWPVLVHRRFAPGLHAKWLRTDVMPIYLASALAAIGGKMIMPDALGRIWTLAWIAIIGGLALVAAALASSEARHRVNRWLGPREVPARE